MKNSVIVTCLRLCHLCCNNNRANRIPVHRGSTPDGEILSLSTTVGSGSTTRLWELMLVVVPLRKRFNRASSYLNGHSCNHTDVHQYTQIIVNSQLSTSVEWTFNQLYSFASIDFARYLFPRRVSFDEYAHQIILFVIQFNLNVSSHLHRVKHAEYIWLVSNSLLLR